MSACPVSGAIVLRVAAALREFPEDLIVLGFWICCEAYSGFVKGLAAPSTLDGGVG